MNILMVVHSYYKEDSRVRREAEALVEGGHLVEVLCLSRAGEPKLESYNGVTVRRSSVGRSKSRGKLNYLREYLSFGLFALLRCSMLACKKKYDVFFAHNMPNFLVFSGLVVKLRGGKLILDMHDAMPELYRNLFGLSKGFLFKVLLIEEWMSNWFADCVMTANKPIAHLLEKRVNKQFFVLHNTPKEEYLDGIELPQANTGRSGPLVLLHHGNIHKRYGLDRILPALKTLEQQKAQSVKLVVHGQGPWYESVQSESCTLGVSHLCEFNGRFYPDELPKILQGAGVGLVLNRKDDLTDLLLPVKMLEYLSVGIPVICPRTDAIEAYFSDDDVWYFDDEKELPGLVATLARTSSEVARKSANASAKYKALSWKREKDSFVKFVEAV